MKHFLFLFFVVSFSASYAQYVSIENEYLRATIKEMFPGCVNANDQLDTSCASLLSVDTLTLEWRTENSDVLDLDLSDLKYFKNLDSLGLILKSNAPFWNIDFKGESISLKNFSITYGFRGLGTPTFYLLNLPPELEDFYCEDDNIEFKTDVPSLKKLRCNYQGNGGAVRIVFPNFTLPESLEEMELDGAIFSFSTNVPTSLKKLHLMNVVLESGSTFSNFLENLPDSLLDLKLEYMREVQFSLPEQFPLQLKHLYLANIATKNALNLPDNLEDLYLREGESGIPSLPNSLKNIYIRSYKIQDPLETFTSLPNSLRSFYLWESPMLIVPDIPDGVNSFEALRAQIQSIGNLPPSLERLDLGVNNIRSLSALPSRLRYLGVEGNPNMFCLPILNDSLRTLNLGVFNPTIKCIPNENNFIKATPNRPLCTDPDSICGDIAFVKGMMYYDQNANGIFDSNEIKLPGGLVNSQPLNIFSVTGNDGAFSLLMDSDTTNSISAIFNNPYVESISPVQHSIATSGIGQVFTDKNFGVIFRPAYDLESYLVSTPQRPGFSSTITATIVNRTITNYNNITLKVFCPDDWSVVATYPAASRVVNDTLFWDNISLSTFQNKKVEIVTYIPPSTILGSSKSYIADVQSSFLDETPSNNIFEYTENIVGSYDPNDKLVNLSTLSPDYDEETELIYTIRFQNTGTDTAFNVVIKDSLLSQLNPLTVRAISSSHSYAMEYKDNGVVSFNFYNIMLPDSNRNEPESHGYILLGIKPEQNLPIGTIIANDASIYFDYNAPIVTEQAITEINTNVSVTELESLALNVYPNPSRDIIRVVNKNNEEETILNIYSLNGMLLISVRSNSNVTEIPVDKLSSGIYILQAQSLSKTGLAKIVIQK